MLGLAWLLVLAWFVLDWLGFAFGMASLCFSFSLALRLTSLGFWLGFTFCFAWLLDWLGFDLVLSFGFVLAFGLAYGLALGLAWLSFGLAWLVALLLA